MVDRFEDFSSQWDKIFFFFSPHLPHPSFYILTSLFLLEESLEDDESGFFPPYNLIIGGDIILPCMRCSSVIACWKQNYDPSELKYLESSNLLLCRPLVSRESASGYPKYHPRRCKSPCPVFVSIARASAFGITFGAMQRRMSSSFSKIQCVCPP